jgi:ribosomal biogenesis protein LAS1
MNIYFVLLLFPTARLVNGFMENPHKKTGHSISDLAEIVGIPRVLVDIRHG